MNELVENLRLKDGNDNVFLVSHQKTDFMQKRSHRGSRFRGVSKNGERWQIMVVSGHLKKYIGAIENEDVAGVLYDKYAIIIQGLKVSVLIFTSSLESLLFNL